MTGELITMQETSSEYSFSEELVHSISHGAGVILSIAGLSWMLYVSVGTSDPWRIIASVVYGLSLISLFLASTIYHALHASPRKHLYKLFDHCAIYLLIAGTYTPFLLVAIREDSGWWMFGVVWALATAGILTKLWFRHRYPRLSLISYLLMGWVSVPILPQLAQAIGAIGMAWLIAGGLCYTVGAAFYAAKRLSFNHAIWHFFVLAGGVCHFLAVIWYVLPVGEVLAAVG